MSLQLKLLLALLPLGLALVVVGVSAVWSLTELGEQSQLILRDNYRSVLAAQQMQEAIERLDRAILLAVVGRGEDGAPTIKALSAKFEAGMKVQEGNITEPGEQEATSSLWNRWQEFQKQLVEFQKSGDRETSEKYYFEQLQPTLEAARAAAGNILSINQDAMVEKSDQAGHLATTTNRALLVTTLAALMIGATVSIGLTNRLLRPLGVLNQAVARLGKGDFDVRAKVAGRDEIALLAGQFNAMAESLQEYRNSSLGELLLAQQAAQAAIDSIPDPVIVFSSEGGILKVNDAAALLVQKSHAGQVDLLATLPPELRAALEQARSHVLEGKGPYVPNGFEDAIAATDANGGECWFLLRATPVYEERGRVTGVTVILQDVTRLRRFDELKDDLVATVAHEFRTPLTSLRMAIHLVLEGVAGTLTEKQGDLLYAARDDCQRLQRTVDELLDLARIQSGKLTMQPRPLRAADLVHQAIDLHRAQAAEKQIALTASVGLGLDQVLADPQRVQLVLSNLLSNAIRHSPQNSTVDIAVVPQNGQIRFAVTDAGEGIPKEYQSAIFQRFFRVPGAQSGAAGLGLPLAKEVVETHGGSIGVESQVARGSKFWFTLPAAPSS
jgi:two-component system, NtrC family, sensor histidine kinase KinB